MANDLFELTAGLAPEQKLCLAILEQARSDWRVATTTLPLKFPTRNVRLAWERQLRFWLTAPIGSAGSFAWVCHSLNLSAKQTRRRVLTCSHVAVKGRSLRRAS